MGDKTARRALSEDEAAILTMIQQGYGSQNNADAVFFTSSDEAVLFVKVPVGTSPLMANLTNLAAWRADGTIASDEELRNQWLRL